MKFAHFCGGEGLKGDGISKQKIRRKRTEGGHCKLTQKFEVNTVKIKSE